ncbi:MAG: LysR substrate-binding domain-containing protein [Defluviicoccus sp.]|nr:LysR substrate-binding domain-containing protein [Defluviicoccus sp.]
MNFRQLECFREIMTTGTVTGAAKALGISQPSASGLIANLERELGFPLFRRVRGRLAPTPEARYLSSDVERTLDSVELTAQRARQIRDQTFGNLVVAAYPDIAIDFLPRVVSRFRAGRPELRVTVLARRSEMMQGLLTTQLYDLAVVETSLDHPSVQMEEFAFRCVCAVPRDHALAERKSVRPDELDGTPFISLLPEHAVHAQTEQAFLAENARWNVVIETQTMESVCGYVRHGAGIGLVDPLTARRHRDRHIAFCEFEPGVTFRVALLLPRDRQRSAILEGFMRALRSDLMALSQGGKEPASDRGTKARRRGQLGR